MKALEALKITTNAVRLDATLRKEDVNLNRMTFWFSELSYGRKWFADSLTMAGNNDIVRTAASITERAFTAPELLNLITTTEGK